jgi:hypothetical protein
VERRDFVFGSVVKSHWVLVLGCFSCRPCLFEVGIRIVEGRVYQKVPEEKKFIFTVDTVTEPKF